ncbi:MAG: ABC transporter permease subunit [Streptosporangiaceae bacterium]|nr:ABC transporter permease subunit [Streptosporangiaceae bacterium]MBV9857342.1 ABC transporter permease subunit [Streptosporangiaceae bacterium]
MREALHAEWTKARTAPGTIWLLFGTAGLTVALGGLVTASIRCGYAGCGQDPAKVSLTGIYLGQAVVGVLAVLAMGEEYSSGMIRVTLSAMPRRETVLAAKAVILGGMVLAAGVVAVLPSVLMGGLLLPGEGFTAGNGYPSLSLADGPVLRAAAGSVLYLGLIALLSLGVASAVRDSAVAIGIVLALLFLFPVLAHFAGDAAVQRHLEQIGPMTAGMAIQDTIDLASQPIGPWAGLGVLAAWATGALLAGGMVLRLRDA